MWVFEVAGRFCCLYNTLKDISFDGCAKFPSANFALRKMLKLDTTVIVAEFTHICVI